MRWPAPGLLALCILSQLGGCGASPLAQRWPQRRPLGAAIDAYHPPPQPPESRDATAASGASLPGPDEPLSREAALALALMHHPALAGFGLEVRAAEARAMQARLWPNPALEAEVEGVGQSSDSAGLKETETTLRLSQPILTGGKIATRTRIAELERDLAAWDYEARRLDVFTRAAQGYIDVLAARRGVEVAQRTFDLARQVLDTVSRQVEAGQVSSIERRRATVEASEARIARDQARRALRGARAGLAGAIGLKEASFGQVQGELEPPGTLPSLEVLMRELEGNPTIARWAAEFEQRQARIDLAQARAIPDVTVSAGLQRFNDRDDYGGNVALGLPLPLFDRNQGNILEARFDLAAARAWQRETVIRLRSDLAQSYQRLQAIRGELQTLEAQTLPAARSAYHDIRTTYRQGQRPLLEVLDAQRTLFSLEARQVDALADYHGTAAHIERLIGRTLESLSDARPSPAKPRPSVAPGEPGD